MMKKGKKISIIGAGNVGATIAFALAMDGMASDIALIDINQEKAKGEAMDIVQGTPFSHHVDVYAGDYASAKDSDIVVITAGVGRKPGQTRIDLAQINVDITKKVIPELMKYAPDAIYIVVSNPVDVLTYTIKKISGLPDSRVFGSGTMLDTARLRSAIADYVGLQVQNIHADVLGEHGDTSMIPWSLATIAGMPMEQYFEKECARHKTADRIELAQFLENMQKAGGKIISAKGATYYAIASSVRKLCESVIRDVNTIHTVSGMLTGQYGVSDVCVSLPFVIGAEGVGRAIEIPMTDAERAQFVDSANAIKDIIKSLAI